MIGVAVMGCGVVGSGVVKMLLDNRDILRRTVGDEVFPLYMLDIRELETPEGVTLTHRFEDILEDDRIRIVVETIGGCGLAFDFSRRCLEAGKHVITSNKELVAEHGDELLDIARAHQAAYLYEASVGGGIPIIRPIQQDLRANRLTEINGIVNGSTNYLLSQMAQKGVGFPAALGEAKRLGYVEANPDADVEGWDARRKLAILANAAFGARLKDNQIIPTTGISSVTLEDMRAANAFGGAVKLIAHAALSEDGASWNGWVHPCFVPAVHPLYNVCDVFNGILVHGDFVGDVMFFGRGAGSYPTASAVVGDVLEAAQSLDKPRRRLSFEIAPRFEEQPDAPRRILFRASGNCSVLHTALPGSEIKPCEGGFAVMTAGMPANLLKKALSSLPDSIHIGAPMYVLG